MGLLKLILFATTVCYAAALQMIQIPTCSTMVKKLHTRRHIPRARVGMRSIGVIHGLSCEKSLNLTHSDTPLVQLMQNMTWFREQEWKKS